MTTRISTFGSWRYKTSKISDHQKLYDVDWQDLTQLGYNNKITIMSTTTMIITTLLSLRMREVQAIGKQ